MNQALADRMYQRACARVNAMLESVALKGGGRSLRVDRQHLGEDHLAEFVAMQEARGCAVFVLPDIVVLTLGQP